MVYVEDELEQYVTPEDFEKLDPAVQQKVKIYSFRDEKGNRIISWDHAKYVNHSCDFNTISTGYGFEIAVRDIPKGEQITDEYGLFNLENEMICQCGSDNCRGVIRPGAFDCHYEQWDAKIKQSLLKYQQVKQPLEKLLSETTCYQLQNFMENPDCYRSVKTLKYQG